MPHPLKQLTPNLWVSKSQFANLSSGIIRSGDSVCLIDPGMLPAEIESQAAFVSRQNVNYQFLVLTHSHWDHLFGPEYFPSSRVIAHANYPNEVRGEVGHLIHQQVEKFTSHFEIDRNKPFLIPQPHETFEDSLSISVGNLSLQLIHAPGHAADQLVIYLPEDGALWAGDMLSDSEIPYVNHNLAAYEATLDMLAELEITVLVPGHGTPTMEADEIQSRIKADHNYLSGLRDQVTKAIDKGLPIAETVEVCTSFQHHDLDANAGAHRLNVESVYIELGGSADPKLVGWHKSFE